jgi:signal transduction histidine kinase
MSRGSIIGVLGVVLCVPAVTVAWLAVRLLEQDRALESQRAAERREQASANAVQKLSSILSNPSLLLQTPREGALLAVLPGSDLLYRNRVEVPPEPPSSIFAEAEVLEFQPGSAATAAEKYRKLASSPDSAIRAAALMRLGRSLRKLGRTDDALQAYDALARMESAVAGDWPAPLAARWSRCQLLESAGRSGELRQEALVLRELLLSGRHAISRPSYMGFAHDVAQWTDTARPVIREALTEAVLQLEIDLHERKRPASGRGLVRAGGLPLTLVWEQRPASLAVFAATPEFVEREWIPQTGGGVSLRDDSGQDITAPASGQAVVRYPVETHLPWAVVAAAPDSKGEFAGRRRLLLILLAAVGLFTVCGAFIVVKVLRRELALGRLQQEFVAAVSHEFRTPLTTLRQITEALEDGRVVNEQRRVAYYHSLSRATQRLQRLVEDLLDFRRMQSGAVEYRPARINARELTDQIAGDFQRDVKDRGFEVAASVAPDVWVLADREAVGRALWNLLDNAVKYSAESRRIELQAERRDRFFVWSVKDYGIGIPSSERAMVFHRFYRGDEARRTGIRGTGIGLAMVEQIVRAHGGSVGVTSEPGAGSVFTISIPVDTRECHAS